MDRTRVELACLSFPERKTETNLSSLTIKHIFLHQLLEHGSPSTHDAVFHSLFVLLGCYLIRNGTERASPDSVFIDGVAGQRTKERDQCHSSGSPLVIRLTVIPESEKGAENSIQDRS